MTQPNPIPKETLYSKIKGTSFYQVPWHAMCVADELEARREPQNRYDSNAIALYHQGVQVGHIDRDVAAELAPMMDEKTATVRVYISDLTGGDKQLDFFSPDGAVKEKTKSRGCNIRIEIEYAQNFMDQFIETAPQIDFF